MLKHHQQLQIRDMLANDCSVSDVAKRLGVTPATVYKYKKLFEKPKIDIASDFPETPSSIEPFQSLIDYHIKKRDLKPSAVLLTVQQAGYVGSRSTFERYYRQRKQYLRPKQYIKHVETDKGYQAQVDWGHFGEINIDGIRQKVYLFAYILSWSRAIYLEFVVSQKQRTFQTCHINAFEKLGIPKTIAYDNLKSVVNRRERLEDGSKKIHYNAMFMDFARYYQFKPEACAPYWPQSKGKIERTIRYVRDHFPRVSPTVNLTLDELNQRISRWVEENANQHLHRTLQQKPYDRWLEEKEFLSFPKLPPYVTTPLRTCHTNQFGLFIYETHTYNLGPDYAQMKLEVREMQHHGRATLEIYRRGTLVHEIAVPPKKHGWVSVAEPAKPKKNKDVVGHYRSGTGRKLRRSYDIDVEQRSLEYYNLITSTEV